ncbi:MAG: DsbC family protein [Steroidobacteraceae bacterium]
MKSTSGRILILALLGALSASLASAADTESDTRAALAKRLPGAKPSDLRPSPIDGMYEFTRGADIAYVTRDGKYVIAGDLYDLAAEKNLSEDRRRDARLKLLAGVGASDRLEFAPSNPRYTITVFTDVDCGYCRKLHSQIAEYNRLGVAVDYLFFPRSGPGTDSWHKAESVWCSSDRNAALTSAKRGEPIKAKPCANTPVARHYALGEQVGVHGTPAMIMPNGEMLPGYVPPAMLVRHLQTSSK